MTRGLDTGAAPVSRTSGTGGWIYLALLGVVAVVVALVSLASDPGGGETRALPGVVEPVELVLRVDGEGVVLEGDVPADDVRDRLVDLAGARFGPPNVVDALTLDERTTLEGGVVAVVGSTGADDPNPLGLQADIASAFLLRSGPVDIETVGVADEDGPAVAMVPATDG